MNSPGQRINAVFTAIIAAVLMLQLTACSGEVREFLGESDFVAWVEDALNSPEGYTPETTEPARQDGLPEGGDAEAEDTAAAKVAVNVSFSQADGFFTHLTGSGSAGFSGQGYVDVQFYDGYYYYSPHYVPKIMRVSEPGREAEIIFASTRQRASGQVAHVSSLCIVDDYIFFWDGDTVVALDLLTGKHQDILTVKEGIGRMAMPFYYIDGQIYLSLEKPARVRHTYIFRFDPADVENTFEQLCEGRISGVDATNKRLVYYANKDSDLNPGREGVYIYDLTTDDSKELDTDIAISHSPAVEVSGVLYASALTKEGERCICAIDAVGNVQVLPVEAAQFTILDGKIYYSKACGGLFVWDMSDETESALAAEETPVPWEGYDSFYIRPVGEFYIAYLIDCGPSNAMPWNVWGAYVYDIRTGEVFGLE